MQTVHPTFSLTVPHSATKLILMPCPGTKGITLEVTLEQLKKCAVQAIVTLMPSDELQSNSLADLSDKVRAQGISWFHLPIEDDKAPQDPFLNAWKTAGPAIQRLIEQGKNIAIHCKGGSGRTGVVAAQILLERGESLEEVIAQIKKLRPNAFKPVCHLHYLQLLNNNSSQLD